MPDSSQQLFDKTQPIPNDDDAETTTQLTYGADGAEPGTGKETQSVELHVVVLLVRITALVSALSLSYLVYLDLSQEIYTELTRNCMVLLTVCLLIGNLPLMGHCLL